MLLVAWCMGGEGEALYQRLVATTAAPVIKPTPYMCSVWAIACVAAARNKQITSAPRIYSRKVCYTRGALLADWSQVSTTAYPDGVPGIVGTGTTSSRW